LAADDGLDPVHGGGQSGSRGYAGDAAADRGGADLVAVQARARLSWAAERRVHDQVHLTGEYPRHHGRLAVRAGSVAVLSHDLGTNPVAAQHLRGSLGGPDLKPRSARRLTGKIIDRLSRLATDTNARPLTGSDPYTAAWAFAYAVPNARSMPITSPVERISGPSTVSTPCPARSRNRPNGSTASFTATGASSGRSPP